MTQNINTKNRGFTIVELLIVIVVIAILAAITIVAYNGIQNRAKTSAGQSLANTVIKKAEAANAVAQVYPSTVANFAAQTDSTLAGSGLYLKSLASAPTNSNTVEYIPCTTPAGAGAQISYWDYTLTTPAKVQKTIGNSCTTWGTAVDSGASAL